MMHKKYPIVLGMATFEGPINKNDKLIITVGCSPKGALLTSKLRIWVKTRSGTYRQVGLIQNLNLSARVERILAQISVLMPEDNSGFSSVLRKSLSRNKKCLRDIGVNVKDKKL